MNERGWRDRGESGQRKADTGTQQGEREGKQPKKTRRTARERRRRGPNTKRKSQETRDTRNTNGQKTRGGLSRGDSRTVGEKATDRHREMSKETEGRRPAGEDRET